MLIGDRMQVKEISFFLESMHFTCQNILTSNSLLTFPPPFLTRLLPLIHEWKFLPSEIHLRPDDIVPNVQSFFTLAYSFKFTECVGLPCVLIFHEYFMQLASIFTIPPKLQMPPVSLTLNVRGTAFYKALLNPSGIYVFLFCLFPLWHASHLLQNLLFFLKCFSLNVIMRLPSSGVYVYPHFSTTSCSSKVKLNNSHLLRCLLGFPKYKTITCS